ncbi:60S ribosomal subunit assembly/export protein [Lambiella insularis]|nr:60S ribosomal subunit assembly/export protein [Lambiella insularis]
MAPNRPSSKSSRGDNGRTSRRGSTATASKSRIAKKARAPLPKQQKTKPSSSVSRSGQAQKKKRKLYTEKELGLPKLNMITPVGVEVPRGRKRAKVFVDDAESMMTILAMVNADKEGQIESKMVKSRHMEEIREARKAEATKREEMHKGKLEAAKESMRKKRKRKGREEDSVPVNKSESLAVKAFKPRKRVSFGGKQAVR